MAVETLPRSTRRQAPDDPAQPRTVVVGYDGSEAADAALALVAGRAGPQDTIAVIHAYQPVGPYLGYPGYEHALIGVQEQARDILAQAARAAAGTEAEVRLEMHEGAPAEVLARLAALRGADEVVVGTRGLGRLRAALGSVSQDVLRRADRPVLVVPAAGAHPD